MKRENKVIYILLVVILITQFVILKRVSDVEDSILGVTTLHLKTNDILTGRICRILDYFNLPTEVIIDNPDGTTTTTD